MIDRESERAGRRKRKLTLPRVLDAALESSKFTLRYCNKNASENAFQEKYECIYQSIRVDPIERNRVREISAQ